MILVCGVCFSKRPPEDVAKCDDCSCFACDCCIRTDVPGYEFICLNCINSNSDNDSDINSNNNSNNNLTNEYLMLKEKNRHLEVQYKHIETMLKLEIEFKKIELKLLKEKNKK